MSLLSSLPEREEKEKRVTSGLRNCVLYLSIFSPVSKSVSFVCSFVVFALFLFVWWHQRGSDEERSWILSFWHYSYCEFIYIVGQKRGRRVASGPSGCIWCGSGQASLTVRSEVGKGLRAVLWAGYPIQYIAALFLCVTEIQIWTRIIELGN